LNERLQAPDDGASEPDQTSDHGSRDEQRQRDQQEPADGSAVPQLPNQAAEDLPPEEDRGGEREDREQHAEDAVERQAHLLFREAFSSAELAPQVVAGEL